MANMGYCRFENTASDLLDRLEHLDDELSPDEGRARKRLIRFCFQIVEDFLDEDGNLDSELVDELPIKE